MSLSAINCLSYKATPIRRLASLAEALRTDESRLLSLAGRANQLYRIAQEIPKNDGSIRYTYNAQKPLKDIHGLIKSQILDRVSFPTYLTGSIKGRDYKTNATLHSGAKIVISEDISTFFPATTPVIIFDVWRHFFGFSEEVATCLTRLTTRDGELPQGAITSPQLANLAFWRDEPALHARLATKGIVYSRFVDDLAISSRTHLTTSDKTEVIRSIYRMMRRRGYNPKRKKHGIHTAKGRMTVTKLTVNEKPGLDRKERSLIRAMVHRLECYFDSGVEPDILIAALPKVMGKVSLLGRFHPGKADPLKKRLAAIKQAAIPMSNKRALENAKIITPTFEHSIDSFEEEPPF